MKIFKQFIFFINERRFTMLSFSTGQVFRCSLFEYWLNFFFFCIKFNIVIYFIANFIAYIMQNSDDFIIISNSF